MNFEEPLINETMPIKIYRILRKAIISGKIQPGDRLIQDELAKKFGVSRMPIREAVKQLAAEGYVNMEPHKGAVVKAFTVDELQEIYFLRAKFEPIAAEESLKNSKHSIVEQLKSLNEGMKQSPSTDDYIQLNIQFHQLLIANCPWEKLNTIVQSLWSGFPQQTPHLLKKEIQTSINEHDQMIQALEDKNIALMCKLLEDHITRAGQDVMKNFKR